jgi:hypothetical protein
VLLAERSGDGAREEWLADLGDDPHARVITLRPLSPRAVTAIVADRLTGDVDDALG